MTDEERALVDHCLPLIDAELRRVGRHRRQRLTRSEQASYSAVTRKQPQSSPAVATTIHWPALANITRLA